MKTDYLFSFQEYDLLCILDFNNVRKRMSVILRKDGEIRLYTKGADNVIYDRLKSNQGEVKSKTQEHLNVSIAFYFLYDIILPKPSSYSYQLLTHCFTFDCYI